MATIRIDPGHGPGNTNRGPTGYYEHEGMWKLSCYLKATLERCGFAVLLTRTQGECPKLSDRGDAAEGCVLFLSEHSNACNGAVRGCEVYYSVRRPGDRDFAAALAGAAAGVMGNNSRGPKTRLCTNDPTDDYYTVMSCASATDCPHVLLCETGFHDNTEDEAVLKSDTKLIEIAEAQAKVICSYLGQAYIEDKPVGPGPVAAAYGVGDQVHFKGGPVYASGSAAEASGSRGECDTTITKMAPDKPHPIHCVGGGVYGWVDADSIDTAVHTEPAPDSAPEPETSGITPGCTVRLIAGAKTYTGGGLAGFVYDRDHIVKEINGDRAVITCGGVVVAAVHAADLRVV